VSARTVSRALSKVVSIWAAAKVSTIAERSRLRYRVSLGKTVERRPRAHSATSGRRPVSRTGRVKQGLVTALVGPSNEERAFGHARALVGKGNKNLA
jgi:hypothetical protein